jgi:hypothetical protein
MSEEKIVFSATSITPAAAEDFQDLLEGKGQKKRKPDAKCLDGLVAKDKELDRPPRSDTEKALERQVLVQIFTLIAFAANRDPTQRALLFNGPEAECEVCKELFPCFERESFKLCCNCMAEYMPYRLDGDDGSSSEEEQDGSSPKEE